jgi:DNA-binding NarL/FixJ family response regulator
LSQLIRLILAEDHTIVRAALRSLLQRVPHVEVIGEAADGNQAVMLAKELRPQLVVMDIMMPQLNGLEALVQIRRASPETKILLLSMFADEEHVLQALRLGASGYLSKDASPTELDIAIHAVARGETYLDPRVAQTILNVLVRSPSGSNPVFQKASPFELLTPRQRQILQLAAEGKSTKTIATLLNMKVKTVEIHRALLMKRLGVHNIAGLVRYAVGHGIISCEE